MGFTKVNHSSLYTYTCLICRRDTCGLKRFFLHFLVSHRSSLFSSFWLETFSLISSLSPVHFLRRSDLETQVISIGRERYTVGEALFQPSILGVEEDGLADQLLRSVSMCFPPENQRQLIENIVLCGGTSTMAGLSTSFHCTL